ncbi:hypothetical protein PRUPE_2G235600 [Prunus persica]|uniref:Uncharacterized protein n=1 Tax=Prunus persica TaxID=3760 RepID=A0A251QKL3_PRUPE|nr:hypothetical protein PRUPE_2G235600 [Prunus persica]
MKLLLFSSMACRGDSPRSGTPQVDAAPCHIHLLRLYIPRGIASWLFLGWVVEERRMPTRRLYKHITKRRKKLELTENLQQASEAARGMSPLSTTVHKIEELARRRERKLPFSAVFLDFCSSLI